MFSTKLECIKKQPESTLLDGFRCPITGNIMKEPVTAMDGYTYEKAAIEYWFASGKTISPTTEKP